MLHHALRSKSDFPAGKRCHNCNVELVSNPWLASGQQCRMSVDPAASNQISMGKQCRLLSNPRMANITAAKGHPRAISSSAAVPATNGERWRPVEYEMPAAINTTVET